MQYLIGYVHGQEYIGFKDVKNVQYDETEDYDLILKFEDENDSYEYIKNGEYYVEVKGKAPKFMTYEIVDDVDFNSRQYDLPQEEEDNRPLRSYEFLVCNGEGAASRGLDYDTYNGSYIYQAHDLEEAYKYLTSEYFDLDRNGLDEILDMFDSFKEYWDNQDISGGDPFVIAYRDHGNEVWLLDKNDLFDEEYCRHLDDRSRQQLLGWLPDEYLGVEDDYDDYDESDNENGIAESLNESNEKCYILSKRIIIDDAFEASIIPEIAEDKFIGYGLYSKEKNILTLPKGTKLIYKGNFDVDHFHFEEYSLPQYGNLTLQIESDLLNKKFKDELQIKNASLKEWKDDDSEEETCDSCGEYSDDLRDGLTGGHYCDRCWDRLFFECEECGEEGWKENAKKGPDGRLYCDDCWEDLYVNCYGCNKVIDREDANYCYDNDEYYCPDCWDYYFFTCAECGEVFDKNDGYLVDEDGEDEKWLCPDCYDELDEGIKYIGQTSRNPITEDVHYKELNEKHFVEIETYLKSGEDLSLEEYEYEYRDGYSFVTDIVSAELTYDSNTNTFDFYLNIYHASKDNNGNNPERYTEEDNCCYGSIEDIYDEYPDFIRVIYWKNIYNLNDDESSIIPETETSHDDYKFDGSLNEASYEEDVTIIQKRDEKGRFKGIRPLYDKDENISDYDRVQLKAYNILKSKRPYAVIYAYDQGNGKILLNPPLEKRSQEEVQDFVDSFKTGNQAVRVVVDVFNLTELKKIEYSLRRRNLIQ